MFDQLTQRVYHVSITATYPALVCRLCIHVSGWKVASLCCLFVPPIFKSSYLIIYTFVWHVVFFALLALQCCCQWPKFSHKVCNIIETACTNRTLKRRYSTIKPPRLSSHHHSTRFCSGHNPMWLFVKPSLELLPTSLERMTMFFLPIFYSKSFQPIGTLSSLAPTTICFLPSRSINPDRS